MTWKKSFAESTNGDSTIGATTRTMASPGRPWRYGRNGTYIALGIAIGSVGPLISLSGRCRCGWGRSKPARQ